MRGLYISRISAERAFGGVGRRTAARLDRSPDVAVALTSDGALPAPLGNTVKELGSVAAVKKIRERDAGQWLAAALKRRKLKLPAAAQAALIQRFGSDLAAMSGALSATASRMPR